MTKTTTTSLLLAAVTAFLSCTSAAAGDEEAKYCSLYLAKSTIENAGLGVFTGVPVEEGGFILYGDPSSEIFHIYAR